MIGLRACSRLHFGLLDVGGAAARFGGVGLMIDSPGLELCARPAATWSAEGPLADRVLAFARRFAATVSPELVQPQHWTIANCAPEHMGLGTGTQLGLATAQVLTLAWRLPAISNIDLARRVGRGQRSALGIHGFFQGGFLVEAGKSSCDAIAPLVARISFPEQWQLVLVLPPWGPGLHDAAEKTVFDHLRRRNSAPTDRLCRMVLLGILPALAEFDFAAFGESLFEFNRLAGEGFRAIQGGVYASDSIAELVDYIRSQSVDGVAQSSWGPAVCAVVEDEPRASWLATRVRERFALPTHGVLVAKGSNQGATIRSS